MDLQDVWDLIVKHQELLYGLGFFLWSEILALKPEWRANSVTQLITLLLQRKAPQEPPKP